MTGSVDGHVRTYDLRKGELRSDFIGRKSSFPPLRVAPILTQLRSFRSCDCGGTNERPPVIPGHDAGLPRPFDGRIYWQAAE